MKKIAVLLTLTLLTISIMDLHAQEKNAYVKKISVEGSAEMEIIPDEIYFRITLKEYKSQGKTVNMKSLEKDLAKVVKNLDIPDENFQVENIYGYNWDYRKKKSDEFLASKSYRIKLSDLNSVNQLLEELDPEGINNVNVNEYSHSKIEQYRSELKVKALQAAKEKAGILLAGIGEELGGVLEVSESGQTGPVYPSPRMMSNVAMESDMAGSVGQNIDFKTIKLRFTIHTVFEIK